MFAIIITNDWEIYGDKTGDYFELQHNPLKMLLRDLENEGAKLTVMAEIGQQWVNPISEWNEILRETIDRGHDVQLHYHPQWQKQKDEWSISKLELDEMVYILKKGKNDLEQLLKPINSKYECIAFRAGAYQLHPYEKLCAALSIAGFKVDTSITKGTFSNGYYDFRNIKNRLMPWSEYNNIVEFPIASYKTKIPSIIRYLSKNKMITRYHLSNVKAKKCIVELSLIDRCINKLLPQSIQLDYDLLHSDEIIYGIKKLINSKEIHKVREWGWLKYIGPPIPIILSGHTKNMISTDNICRVVNEIRKNRNVIFYGLQEAIISYGI